MMTKDPKASDREDLCLCQSRRATRPWGGLWIGPQELGRLLVVKGTGLEAFLQPGPSGDPRGS